MATYAIGDLQGCYSPFMRLLDLIRFNPACDRLWLVGDLVNRGPDSLALLRFVKQTGDTVIPVLGNHDLHLLMVAAGVARIRPGDTLEPILCAPDRDELLHWLRHRKLFHYEAPYAMVHAGLLPCWTIVQAERLGREVETALRCDEYPMLFAGIYGNAPDFWQDTLVGQARLRVIVNAMTRMRVCSADGKMNFSYKGDPRTIPHGLLPWFEVPYRASRESIMICGHWSALGLHVTDRIVALDTGCVWGGRLTAIRLDDREIFQIACEQ
ncbi:MAG: symmetrical bis(5'-nucleosyl)-tetraphosphatase [Nitrosomonas sp.]|nr:MAG: symmetrical bis(5'-nucleosyl)-tetraphosphatase [Nitrosomonas sp.]